MTNEQIVNRFFELYSARKMDALNEVLAQDITWYFLGDHKLAGEKKGVPAVLAFFDTMGEIMSHSKPSIEKLITAEKGNYFIECSHVRTNRPDGNNIDHEISVLWTVHNGKIVSGRHFFSDPEAVNQYFNSVA